MSPREKSSEPVNRTTLYLPIALIRRLKVKAAREQERTGEHVTMTAIVVAACQAYLADK